MGDFARDLARQRLHASLTTGTVAGLLPVPGGSTIALTAIEAMFIAKTKDLYNDRIDLEGIASDAGDLLPVAGRHVALTTLAETVGMIPVFGWIAKPFITRQAMATLGEATIRYFEKRHPDQVY